MVYMSRKIHMVACTQVALNLVPSKEVFMQCVAAPNETVETVHQQLQQVVESFRPVLQAVHSMLDSKGLDDPTPV